MCITTNQRNTESTVIPIPILNSTSIVYSRMSCVFIDIHAMQYYCTVFTTFCCFYIVYLVLWITLYYILYCHYLVSAGLAWCSGYFFTVSLWAQNLPVQKILSSTLVCFCLSVWFHGSRPFTGFTCCIFQATQAHSAWPSLLAKRTEYWRWFRPPLGKKRRVLRNRHTGWRVS